MNRCLTSLVALLVLLATAVGAQGQDPGTVLWRFQTGAEIFGAPVLDDAGNVYIASRTGLLYSVDPGGNLRWTYQTGTVLDSTPAIDDTGHLYIGDGLAWVHKVRISDGSRVWRVNLPGALHSDPRPAISHDGSLVWVGSVDNGQEGTLWALRTSDGNIEWTGTVIQWGTVDDRFERNDIVTAPNGNVVAMGWDQGSLVTFEPDGTEVWHLSSAFNDYPSNHVVDPQGRVFGYSYWGFRAFDSSGNELWFNWYYLYAGLNALAIGPDDLIFAAYGGRIRGHDRDDGNILWSQPWHFGAIQILWEPVRGVLYAVGTDYENRQIVALNRQGAIQWQVPWPGFAYRAPVASADGSVLYVADEAGALYAISTGEAPPALDLESGLLIRGLPSDLTVRLADPGETIHFLYSRKGTGTGPCPGQLGGLCLDILDPIRVAGAAAADSSGTAVLRIQVPSSAPLIDVHLQAVARRGDGGSASVKSNALTVPIQ
ncbi:MAG: hypothetical protein D8M59_12950 [Planctomycetes bacterium]|nr:hypothetical protein [Planctomycetota bacterium]